MQLELQMPLGIAFLGVVDRRPSPAIPDDHGAAAIFALGDGAFEAAIVQRMVLDMDRQALLARNQARPLGHGPALEHPIHLQPQIVMQPAGGVFLDDEAVASGGLCPFAARLRRRLEITFFAVGGECHQLALRRGAASVFFFLPAFALGAGSPAA